MRTTSGPSCYRSLQPASKLDTEEEIARHNALLAANTVIDRQTFFERVNQSNRAARNQANALFKRLGIKVAIRKAGSRSKLAHYAVYQNERLIMKLKDETRKIESEPFSPEMAMRLHHQGELREDELYIDIGFGSKKLPKPKKAHNNEGRYRTSPAASGLAASAP